MPSTTLNLQRKCESRPRLVFPSIQARGNCMSKFGRSSVWRISESSMRHPFGFQADEAKRVNRSGDKSLSFAARMARDEQAQSPGILGAPDCAALCGIWSRPNLAACDEHGKNSASGKRVGYNSGVWHFMQGNVTKTLTAVNRLSGNSPCDTRGVGPLSLATTGSLLCTE